MVTNLSKILPSENVVLDLEVSSKKRVFEQAGLIFENNCGISRSDVTDNLFARESLGTTGLGYGVAVPHGRIKGLKTPVAAFVRLATPIPFEAPDGKPVNLLFFLRRPRFQLVAHFHRRHRLDEQRRAGGRLVMHQPRHAAAVLRLDGQTVAVVAHGDNRVLQVLLERG